MDELSSEAAWSAPGRYGPLRLFGMAVLFILAAPVYWHQTQIHSGAVAAAYENADLYQDVYPTFHYGFGRIRSGDLPLWNAQQRCGAPFQANPDTGLFQPLNLIFALLPTEQAMAVHAFLCLALMGFFFVLFARALGVGYVPALIGGVAYACCGASAAALSRPGLADALAWTPLVFWSLREFARRGGFTNAVSSGISGALLLLCGPPAMILAVFCLAIPYALCAALVPDPDPPFRLIRRLEAICVAFVFALAIAAVQWLPTLAWAWSLDRPFDALWMQSVPGYLPGSVQELLAQLLAPKAGALPRVGYLGAMALLGIPAIFFHRTGWRDILFFATGGVTLLFVSVGGVGPMPFGFPYAVFVFPGMFCVAALVALGFDRLLRREQGSRRPRVGLPSVTVLVCALGLFYVSSVEPRGRIVALLLLLAPVVVFRARLVSAICGIAIAGLLFADLASASIHLYNHPFEDAPLCYQRYARSLVAAEEQSLGSRVMVSSHVLDFGLPKSLALIVPALDDANGPMPITRDQAVWWRRLGAEANAPEALSKTVCLVPEAAMPHLLNVMAARVVIAAPNSPMYAGTWMREGPPLHEVKTEDGARIFVNDAALPRASWVPSWRMVEGVAAAADILGQPAFDGTRECLIDRDSEGFTHVAGIIPGPRPLSEPAPAPPADVTCTLEEVTAERVVVQVNAPQPGIVVLADTFAPGWKATLDGAPCSILRVNGLFRGIAVPAAAHHIMFTYRPVSFLMGMGVSLSALAFAALAGFVLFVRN